jgi:hypothetical protein
MGCIIAGLSVISLLLAGCQSTEVLCEQARPIATDQSEPRCYSRMARASANCGGAAAQEPN